MRQLLSILAILLLCCAPLHAQTMKALMFNSTNGQVVANTGTNVLTFTNRTKIESINNWRVLSLENSGIMSMDILLIEEDLNAGYDAPQGSIGNGAGAFWIKYGEASTDWGRALYLDQNGDGGIARTNLGLNNTNVYVYAATALWDTANQQKAIRIADMDVEVNSGMLRTNGPTNTTNVSRWINVLNGTNIYKLPLYK